MVETEKNTLSHDDATLLLYVAGELGEKERATIEARLPGDVSLRERLAALTSLDLLMCGEVDVRPVSAADSRRAMNTTLRLVREQAYVLQGRPLYQPSRRRLAGVPRWAWGTAIAASLVVGALVWITNSEPSPIRSNSIAQRDDVDANGFPRRWETSAFGAAFLPIEAEGNDGSLAEINSELDALSMLAIIDEPIASDAN